MGSGIQLLKVNAPVAEVHGVHTAADVHSDHVGDSLVRNGHGGANSAALSRVHVRHDADL